MKKIFTLMLLAMAVAFVGCKKSDSKDEPSQGSSTTDPSVAPVLTGIDGVWFGEDGDALYISKKNNLVAYLNTNDLTDRKQFIGEYSSEDDETMEITLVRPQHDDETVAISVKKDGEKLVVEIDLEEKKLEKFAYNDYKNFFGTWVREVQVNYDKEGTETNRLDIDAYTTLRIAYIVSEQPLAVLALLLYGSAYAWNMTLNNGGDADIWSTIDKERRQYVWLYDSGLYLFDLSKNEDGIRNESTYDYYNMQKDGKKASFVDVSADGSYTKSVLVHPMTAEQGEKLIAGNTYSGKISETSLYGKKYGSEDVEVVFNANRTGTLKVGSIKLDFKWEANTDGGYARGAFNITCEDESTQLGKFEMAVSDNYGAKVMLGMGNFDGEESGKWAIELEKKQ